MPPPIRRSAYDSKAATKALKEAGLDEEGRWLVPAQGQEAAHDRGAEPDQGSQPGAVRGGRAGRRGLDGARPGRDPCRAAAGRVRDRPPGQGRVRGGRRRCDRSASTPTCIRSWPRARRWPVGSNIIGVQDPELDALLVKARAPGTDEERKAAYKALQEQLGKGRYVLPLAFADEVVVARDTVEGPAVRQVTDPSDRFWDVLTWRLAEDR